MKKHNCWEAKQCGREPGGTHQKDLGICPVTLEVRLNGANGGKNAGRSCWVVAGSLCKGEVQGTFALKYKNCRVCDFYNQVKQKEAFQFELSAVLLSRLKGG